MREYQQLIGSLLFIGLATRPDILHSVNKLSQFNMNPHLEHMAAAKQILRYLKHTIHFTLNYNRPNDPLLGYSDADWATNYDRKSYTGYVFELCGGAITWATKKQTTIALSSTEAEYMALAAATKEAVYLRNLVAEIGFQNLVNAPLTIYCDNQSAIQLAKNPAHHERSKHIDIRYHYIRSVYDKSYITILYISTEDMKADILTKNLS